MTRRRSAESPAPTVFRHLAGAAVSSSIGAGRPAPGPAARPRHLVHVFPSFEVGGVQVRMATVLNHFGARFRHTIVSLDGRVGARTRLDPGLAVDVEPLDRPHRRSLPAAVLQARRTLRRLQPDLLLTYNWGSIEWALAGRLFAACRHIHLESGFGAEEADRQLPRRVRFRRLALGRASRIVVPSFTLYEIATRIWGFAADRVTVIPNGVDCHRFTGEPGFVVPCPALAGCGCIVGTVAPLRPEKNVGRLLRAFAAIAPAAPEARLLIVGDGPQRADLADAAHALGIAARATFAGSLEQIEAAYRWMDVFVVSSDTEQMPNALIQAMATARPVAAVDVGDVRRVLAPENRAFVVDRADEGGLARVIADLAADPDLRARLGRCNRAHVQAHYDLATMLRAYEGVLAC